MTRRYDTSLPALGSSDWLRSWGGAEFGGKVWLSVGVRWSVCCPVVRKRLFQRGAMASQGAVAGDPLRTRRRLLQAQQRATLAGLMDTLRSVVFPAARKNPSKWQVLQRAKTFLQQQEAHLNELLKMKEVFQMDDGGPYSVEEVREEYQRFCVLCRSDPEERSVWKQHYDAWDSPGPNKEEISDNTFELSQSSSASFPSIVEFEGYLLFYRQTVDLLLKGGVLSPEQAGLAVVSEAISGLWECLPGQRRAAFQSYSLGRESSVSLNLLGEPLLQGSPPSSCQLGSQEGSLSSEEDLFKDAFDFIRMETETSSQNRPVLESLDYNSVEDLREIYRAIINFVKAQEVLQTEDSESLFLRCTETFDDDDL
nr:PREDICTED: stimulated by retinoic acid gene 8 protein homolog isoform X2 [Lepisosteus oculatus]